MRKVSVEIRVARGDFQEEIRELRKAISFAMRGEDPEAHGD